MTMINKPLKQRWHRVTNYTLSLHCLAGWTKEMEEELRGPLCISNLIIYGLQSVPSFPSSRASVERTRHCLVGSRLRAVFQCNFPAERVRQEATEWSDEGSWPLV